MGEPGLDDSNVKVAVRVRPMNRRGERAPVYLEMDCYWWSTPLVFMETSSII